MGSQPVKAMVRQGQFFKIPTALETGAADGCWTFARYREWLERRTDWHVPAPEPATREARDGEGRELVERARAPGSAGRRVPSRPGPVAAGSRDGVLEIPSSDEDLGRILDELERSGE
jgi:twitching motility protein PilT